MDGFAIIVYRSRTRSDPAHVSVRSYPRKKIFVVLRHEDGSVGPADCLPVPNVARHIYGATRIRVQTITAAPLLCLEDPGGRLEGLRPDSVQPGQDHGNKKEENDSTHRRFPADPQHKIHLFDQRYPVGPMLPGGFQAEQVHAARQVGRLEL